MEDDLRRLEAYQYAIAAAQQGWAVFPLRPNGKEPPAGLKWKDRSTSDIDRIRAYGASVPDANWACDLGKSGLFVVDVDCKRKVDGTYIYDNAGWDEFFKLLAPHDWPPFSSLVGTGSSGLHWWLRQPGKPIPNRTSRGFRPLIDIKSVGGYALLPGCFVPPVVEHSLADGCYVCEEDPLIAQEAPSWLIEILDPPKVEDELAPAIACLRSNGNGRGARAHLQRLAEAVAFTGEPGRNDALNDAAFKMREEVHDCLISATEVISALLQACRGNGLLHDDGERRCLATIVSGLGVTEGM